MVWRGRKDAGARADGSARAAGRARGGARRQRGATLAEFVLVAPVLLGIGGGTVQAGLAYHGKTVLNYATFEAARAGAVRHALVEPMRRELGLRLAPLQGGDGTVGRAAAAVAKSRASLGDSETTVEILNPTPEAFDAWSVTSKESGREVIPNSHLAHRRDEGTKAGVTLQDANLLKIRVTHGFDLKVPVVGEILIAGLQAIDPDPDRRRYYDRGLLPLSSVATVRMQSEVWGDDIVPAETAPGGAAFADNLIDGTEPLHAAEPGAGASERDELDPLPPAEPIDLQALLASSNRPGGGLPLVHQECGPTP